MIKPLKKRLTDILIDSKLITAQQLEEALKVQKEKGGRLGKILVKLGHISEKDLMLALSEELNLPPVNLKRLKIDPEVTKIIPGHVARHYGLIPISRMGNTITVAMSDPLNIFATDDIKVLTGFDLRPIIATEEDISQAIEQCYEVPTTKAIEDILKDVKETKSEVVLEEAGAKEVSSKELLVLAYETPVVKVTDMLIGEAIKRRASDLLIEPLEHSLRVRYRVDGALQEAKAPPKSMQDAIVSRIKVMSELNIAERRLPQDGRFKVKTGGRTVDFRISVIPSSFGEKVALRVLDKLTLTLDVEKLGFEPDPLKDIKRVSLRPHGMILICGPTGCGKTTTLYSILKFVDSPEKNIITVEDPVEYQLEGINQVTYREDIGLSFARALRSILRQDPDIIMIGEIRDYETADIAIKAALTGHLVLSTLHTTDAPGSIVRLINMGVEPFLIASSVIMVGAQRLIRRICPKCKESYKPAPELLKELGLGQLPDINFYRGKGCGFCQKTGYKGLVGLIEVLVLTHEIRELVMKKASEAEIKAASRRSGMATLRENGLRKVMAGITTLEEVLRVTAADQKIKVRE